jgi:hypothetical protein
LATLDTGSESAPNEEIEKKADASIGQKNAGGQMRRQQE